MCAACCRKGRGQRFFNFGAKSAESAVFVFAREWRRGKVRGMLSDRARTEIFLILAPNETSQLLSSCYRECRRRKSARHAVGQGGDRDFFNFGAKSAESAVVVFAIESGEGGRVRGMLSDRARTELSVAVDIFQESLLYTCITKESDHLMCNIAYITTLAK